MKSIHLSRKTRKTILAIISLLESKTFQRKMLNIALGITLLALSKGMINAASVNENAEALLFTIPTGVICILKEVFS